jgi:hypothetical protein
MVNAKCVSVLYGVSILLYSNVRVPDIRIGDGLRPSKKDVDEVF